MTNADRISEVYKGEIWAESAQRRARERIHWLCRQAQGLTLDLGCSQGIASLLLARAGVRTIGVDVELDRLEYAERDRREEPETVARRVSFVGADGARLPFPDQCFDAVLLGEVLEHLVNPVFVLTEVARVLRPGGTVAITVPFGYHPHHDHKASFYPNSLLDLVASYLTPVDLEVAGAYLRLVATPHSSDAEIAAQQLTLDRQPEVEKAFFEAEEALGDSRRRGLELERELKSAQNSLRETEKELQRMSLRSTQAEQQVEQLQADKTQAEQQVGQLQAETRRLETRLHKEQETAAGYRDRIEKLNRDRHALRNRLQIANWKVTRLRARKWWRAGQAIREALRRPWRVLLLPYDLGKIALKPSLHPPRPDASPYEPALESSLKDTRSGSATKPADTSKTKAKRQPGTDWAQQPAVGEVGRSELKWPEGIRSVPRHTGDLWVASIMDEMSSASFGPECHLVTFRPDNWREVLTDVRPHFLMVESAWSGNQGSWQYKVGSYTHPDSVGLPDLNALVDWCRIRNIPTVFWNKEDPIHFDRFKEAAKLFDFVFTTDADCVPRYKQLPGVRAEHIDALPFAAQPKIHNPISTANRRNEPCFAGTYYRNRHVERQQQLEMLLDAAQPFGLIIYDRTYEVESEEFGFPERFQNNVIGHLPYEELVRVYKHHKVFLNANSVTGSPTMFSRRVFELLASGTAVVSTPSEGMQRIFGDLVSVATSEDEAQEAIRRLIEDEAYRSSLMRKATRLVLSEHTYRERLASIANAIGFEVDSRATDRFSLLVLVDRAEGWYHFVEDLQSQIRQPDEVLVGSGSPEAGSAFAEALGRHSTETTIRVVQQESQGRGRSERYRELATLASQQWVAIVDPTHRYGPPFFEDLILATTFADADVIGKPSIVDFGAGPTTPKEQNLFVDSVHPLACLVRRELATSGRSWPCDLESAAQVMPSWRSEGIRIFVTHAGDFNPESSGETHDVVGETISA